MTVALSESTAPTRFAGSDSYWPSTWHPVSPLVSACCCSARPTYQAVIPPSSQVPAPVEILLCTHHCRESRGAVRRIGGAIYDARGDRVTTAI